MPTKSKFNSEYLQSFRLASHCGNSARRTSVYFILKWEIYVKLYYLRQATVDQSFQFDDIFSGLLLIKVSSGRKLFIDL